MSHGADKHVRTLTTKSQLIALMYAQLSGAQSLREIEAGLQSHATRLYHLGSDEVSRSTLADANAQRPWQVFSGLFAHLVGQLTRGLKRKTGEAVQPDRFEQPSSERAEQGLGEVLGRCLRRQDAHRL